MPGRTRSWCMCGARRMAPLFEQCASASGATARTSSTAATKRSCCCSVKSRSARVGVGEVREHARDLDVGGVLGERAQQLGQPVGDRRRAAPSRCRPSRARAPRRPTRAAALAMVSTPSSSYTVVSMPSATSASWLPGSPRPTINTGTPKSRHVERLGRRRHAEPRRAARDRGLGGEPDAVPVAVRLHHRHHAARRRPRARPAPTCWRGSPTRRPRPACAA